VPNRQCTFVLKTFGVTTSFIFEPCGDRLLTEAKRPVDQGRKRMHASWSALFGDPVSADAQPNHDSLRCKDVAISVRPGARNRLSLDDWLTQCAPRTRE
jgi:hypothetical protein